MMLDWHILFDFDRKIYKVVLKISELNYGKIAYVRTMTNNVKG